jgi:hypothetical protein
MSGKYNLEGARICYRRFQQKRIISNWIQDINEEKYDFIFIHINKTAGISIQKALGMPKQLHVLSWHLYKKIDRERWNNCFKFAFVRNPYDRVVSDYHYRCKTNQHNLGSNPLSFKEWVDKTFVECDPFYHNMRFTFMPQIEWLTAPNGKVLIDFIGRFESLEHDFSLICDRLNVKNRLEHENRSSRSDFRSYYDDDTYEIITDWYKKDLDYFNYNFDR